jgi:hypothetical protein
VEHGPFQLAAECRGSCPVALSELAGERALALWADHDGTWAQRFDLAHGSALGVPLALGELDDAGVPYVFALPDGDAAIFGLLADGRVTFARGSEAPARRVAPKVVVPRAARVVRSLAASATGSGLVLLLLRQATDQELRGNDPQIDAELHWLDAKGKPLRAPLIWKTPFGVEARMAACRDVLYLAWDTVPEVRVTRLSNDGRVRAEMLLPPPQADSGAELGPLLCTPVGARLVSGWKKSDEFDFESKISVSEISGSEALPARGRWSTLALPGVPQDLTLKESPFGAYATSAGLKVLLAKADHRRFVGLDLGTGKVEAASDSPKLPNGTPCIPTSDGRRALCVESQKKEQAPGCEDYVARLTATFVGTSTATSASTPRVSAPAPYLDARGAAVPDPGALSDEEERERRALLRCGEPGWDGLRKAIQSFCEDLRARHIAAKKKRKKIEDEWMLKDYCGEQPSSLLFQATNCTGRPLACEHSSVSSILSVERAEFEQGSDHLFLDFRPCELYLAGGGDTWRVVDHECGGD